MARDWTLVSTDGYDVEDAPHPRTVTLECPNCERSVRFEQRLLVKNLRVLGVALLATGKSREVLQCERCGVCVEVPEGLAPNDSELELLRKKATKIELELARWSSRAELATQRGDEALAREALEQVRNARRELAALEAKQRPQPVGRPKVVHKPGVKKSDEELVKDDDEADFLALKRKLASRQGEGESPAEKAADAPAPSAASAEPEVAPEEPSLEQELAAMKARLAGGQRKPAADTEQDDALRALKRKLGGHEEPAPSPAAEQPGPEAPPEDDPLASLKGKLKKR